MADIPRHSALVRATHWITALCFFLLLITGLEIVVSHPRFYWGEAGNVNTTPLFKIPIPASRATVPTGYGYVLPDQNGWSRALHFQSAWLLAFAAFFYLVSGKFRGVLPSAADVAATPASLAEHLRFARPAPEEAFVYNPLQKLAYAAVVFILFPLVIWTGLAMSPGFVSIVPSVVTSLGGQQTARTLHFFVTILLFAFLIVHITMIAFAGFRTRMRAMITGRVALQKENA
jgi:thiosulfate reductase cytochrome b subunit